MTKYAVTMLLLLQVSLLKQKDAEVAAGKTQLEEAAKKLADAETKLKVSIDEPDVLHCCHMPHLRLDVVVLFKCFVISRLM